MALSTSTTAPTGWAADAAHSNWLRAQQIASQPYEQYPGQQKAQWNLGQQQGYNMVVGEGAGIGRDAMAQAQQFATQAGQYQPQQVSAGGPMYAAGFGVTNMGEAAATGQNFTDANLNAYMNPYTGAVIDRTMQTLGRQNDMLNNQANAKAASAGAFGGGRQAVMNTENNRNFLDTAANTSANLNNQNFLQAQNAIQSDQARAQQLSQYNASNTMQARSQNAQAHNQASMQYANNADRMAQLNTENSLRAQMANQQAGLTGASTRLSAANALNGMGLDQQQHQLNGANAAFQMGQAYTGDQQQYLDLLQNNWAAQKNYPMTQLGILQQGLNGYSSGTSTSTPYHSNTAANVLAGGLGVGQILANGSSIASGASSLAGMLPDIGAKGWGGWFG